MAEIVSLREAVATLLGDGDTVALEGFTHDEELATLRSLRAKGEAG